MRPTLALGLVVSLAPLGCGTPQPPLPSRASVSAARPPASAPASASAPVEPPPPPREPEPLRARFLSVGDVIFGRRVQDSIDRHKDPEHPFLPLAKLYAEVDFTFANLENPFFSGKKPNKTPPGKRYAVLWAKPEHASTLVKYKLTAVNLANNHAMDQDLGGLKETLAALDAHKVQHVGAGLDLDAAWTPFVVDVRGLRIGFVGASFTSKNDQGNSRNNYVARVEDEGRLAKAIQKAREGSHFVVATMHAGEEHKWKPNPQQKRFARAAIKAGADLVIGAHPHVVQPAEKVDGKWIFYSLGNFVFDQPLVHNSEAVAVELQLSLAPGAERATLDKLRAHPVYITDCAPAEADEAHSASILGHLGVSSRDLAP